MHRTCGPVAMGTVMAWVQAATIIMIIRLLLWGISQSPLDLVTCDIVTLGFVTPDLPGHLH
jgi:hypothetical protein